MAYDNFCKKKKKKEKKELTTFLQNGLCKNVIIQQQIFTPFRSRAFNYRVLFYRIGRIRVEALSQTGLLHTSKPVHEI